MTPQEKARQLINDFGRKDLANIAIEELIKVSRPVVCDQPGIKISELHTEYWVKVKKELLSL